MEKMGTVIENLDYLNGRLLLQLGATFGQLSEELDHTIRQDDARRYGDFNFNRRALKIARMYRRYIVDVIKKKGRQWLQRYKDYIPEPLLTHFDGFDFILVEN